MRIRKMPMVLMVIGLVVIVYLSTANFAQPIDDFEPDVPDDPEEPPSSDPIAYAWFEFKFSIFGILQGAITDVDAHTAAFISFDEGRMVDYGPLFSLPFPDPPDECQAYISIRVTGLDLSESWVSERYEVESFPTNVSDVSGRVFFYTAGQYSYSAILYIDSGLAGDARAVATRSGSFEVST